MNKDNNDLFINKLSTLNDLDKRSSYNYFVKQDTITKMFEMIRSKAPFYLNPFGNYNAKVSVIVDFNKTNDRAIELVKKFYVANKADFYSLYVTPYNKTHNNAINKKLVEKEHEIIRPKRTIILGDYDVDIKQDVYSVSQKDMNMILLCIDNKDIRAEHEEEFQESKTKFLEAIQFALYGHQEKEEE